MGESNMIARCRSRRLRADDGMTLAELLVYMVLLLVVMGMATALFIDVIRTQSEITVMAQENNDAQVLFEQIERDVRNAGWVDVRYGGDLAVMRVRTASESDHSVYMCVAYFFDEPSGTMYTTRLRDSGSVTGPVLTTSSRPEAFALAQSWNTWHDNLARNGSQRVFGPADELITDVEKRVQIAVVANATADRKSVVFGKTVSLRTQSGLAGGCEG